MNDRDAFIRIIRSEDREQTTDETSADEVFQNTTLRPVLKLQNDLLLRVFSNYIVKSKADYSHFSIEKKLSFIEQSIQRDIKFRNVLKGIIIGSFSIDEFERYLISSSDLNKRMMRLLIERLQNQVQLFDIVKAG